MPLYQSQSEFEFSVCLNIMRGKDKLADRIQEEFGYTWEELANISLVQSDHVLLPHQKRLEIYRFMSRYR